MSNNNSKELQDEYQRFIQFGGMLNASTRKYLVEYFKYKLDPENYEPVEINDQYFRYFKTALDDLFGIEGLLLLCKQHPKIEAQIIKDTLYWLRKTWGKVRKKNPFDDEYKRLEAWSVTPLFNFPNRWHLLTNYLSANYQREELDTTFYQQKFTTFFKKKVSEFTPKETEDIERIIKDLLAQWDALLYAKTIQYQLEFLEEETAVYNELVHSKVTEFNKLSGIVNPFTEYLGRYWDMSRSLWKDTAFDVIGKYDDLLKREKELKELADMLGRMREAEIELQEETLEKVIIRQEWKSDPQMRSEIVGIGPSNRLNDLVSSEAALLSDASTETLFLQKYADQQLLTFRYEDRKLVKSEDKFMEVNQYSKLKDKGPFMICVDTSESMYGRPEQIAKVLCLGILKMASLENRRAFLLNFSSGVQTIDLQEVGNSIDSIAKFLRMSFNGGTNISLPLYEVFRQLKTENYRDADVLIISDFILYEIEEKIVQGIRSFQQNQNTQFHSLILSDEANQQIIREMDTCWLYDPKEKGIIRSMTRGLHDVIR